MDVIPRVNNKQLEKLRKKYHRHVPTEPAREYVEALEARLALAEHSLNSIVGQYDENATLPSIHDHPAWEYPDKLARFQNADSARRYFKEVGGWQPFKVNFSR